MTPEPRSLLCCGLEGGGWGVRSDWLQTAPGLKPKGEWKPLSATYNGEDPGSGERFASPGPEGAALSHPERFSIYSPATLFQGELEFCSG